MVFHKMLSIAADVVVVIVINIAVIIIITFFRHSACR